MIFCIITHVIHTQVGDKYFGYAPYINEMNIWLKNVNKVIIVAPKNNINTTAIHNYYQHDNIKFIEVPQFSFTNFKNCLKSIFYIPIIFFQIIKAMFMSNHIHLRCPGNMGLLASVAQVFFPNKYKTAKYAGNWDSKSIQPLSYKIQKYILSNTFLSKKIKVLVYGEWQNQTKNIKSFFTATYFKNEIVEINPRKLDKLIEFIFVGTLSKGKQPLYAIELINKLIKKGYKVQLSIYGEGIEKQSVLNYINQYNLSEFIFLKGNVNREEMKTIYQLSHFLILPSKSEGWPKVVAEAMFWGCFPIATNVSCVSNMLNDENRGMLLSLDKEIDTKNIEKIISNQTLYNTKIKSAINWSRQFTIDKFESEIKILLQK